MLALGLGSSVRVTGTNKTGATPRRDWGGWHGHRDRVAHKHRTQSTSVASDCCILVQPCHSP